MSEDRITKEKATEHGQRVYKKLLAQGRAEPEARRDAEKWVMGNFGIEVKLPEPVPRVNPNPPPDLE